jgi:integrase
MERKPVAEVVAWAKSFAAGQTLFDRLEVKLGKSEHTIEGYSKGLWKWFKFSKLNPDETVAKWKSEAKADYSTALDEWDRFLEKFILWQERELKVGRSTSSLSYNAVKSLLKWNSNLKLTIASPAKAVQRIIPPITLDEFKALYNVGSESQRWIICGLKDSGISREDFVKLTYGDVKDQILKGERFVHLSLVREKTKTRYETFLGPNAVEALKAYLRVREVRGEKLTQATPLSIVEVRPWRALNAVGLSQVLRRLGRKIEIELSSHRLRKTFETYLALDVKHPIILKYWTGHRISGDIESHYIIPPTAEQRKLYENAYKAIDISGGSLEERAREAAKVEFEKLLTPEARELAERYKILYRSSSKKHGATEKKEPCPKGSGKCQKIVSEADLGELLANGWKMVGNLPSGKIVVSNEEA